jgi:hypothetical protein
LIGFVVFHSVLVVLSAEPKNRAAHILAYLPRLDTAVTPNGKYFRASGNSLDHSEVTI